MHKCTDNPMHCAFIGCVHQELLGGSERFDRERIDMGIPIDKHSKQECSPQMGILCPAFHVTGATTPKDNGCQLLVFLSNLSRSKDYPCQKKRIASIINDQQITEQIGGYVYRGEYPAVRSVHI